MQQITLQGIINGALPGDTIYIENSTTIHSPITLNKRLVLIGSGAYQTGGELNLDPPLIDTPNLIRAPYDSNEFSKIHTINLNPGSKGSIVRSLRIQNVKIADDSITVQRCHVESGIGITNNAVGVKILTTYIHELFGQHDEASASCSDLLAQNCILDHVVRIDSSGVDNRFFNCIFGVINYTSSVHYRFKNCEIHTSVFAFNGLDSVILDNCTGNNNVFSTEYTLFPAGQISGVNNHYGFQTTQIFNNNGLTYSDQTLTSFIHSVVSLNLGVFGGSHSFVRGYLSPLPNIWRFEIMNNAGVNNNQLVAELGANKPPTGISNSNLVGLEYYIGPLSADPGVGNAIQLPLTSGSLINETLTIDVSTLPPQTLQSGSGNRLNVRFKNSQGQWSHTATKTFTSFKWFQDSDQDGFGNPLVSLFNANQPVGYVSNNQDCDDNDGTKHDTFAFYVDADGDGYGVLPQVQVCAANINIPPPGYSNTFTDCNDNDSTMHQEYFFYFDADFDGYGSGSLVLTCAQDSLTPPSNYSNNNNDCAPFDDLIHEPMRFFRDLDQDGYGDLTHDSIICTLIPPVGYVADSTDCDDNDSLRFTIQQLYEDSDGDGYGNISQSQLFCVGLPASYPTGYVNDSSDCDDNDSLAHQEYLFYTDTDLDGFGVPPLVTVCASNPLVPPTGFSLDSSDCNDNLSTVYPGMIDLAEYYFDTDPGPGLGNIISLNPTTTDSIDEIQTISIPSAMPKGMHKLMTRIHTCGGTWGHPILLHLYVRSPNEMTPIAAMEYFFDIDPGPGNGIPVALGSAQDTLQWTDNITLPAGLPPGFHVLSFRVKTTAGHWSMMDRKMIHVISTQVYTMIEAAEYFIDQDPGVGNGTPIPVLTIADTVNLSANVQIPPGLSLGMHRLSIRVKNQFGEWSTFSHQMIRVRSAAVSYPIVSGEYFFDTDPGPGNGISFSVTMADTVLEVISCSVPATLPIGSHRLAVRVRDQSGLWSHTEYQDVQVQIPVTGILNMKVFLQGFFTGNQTMTAVLMNQGQGSDPGISDSISVFLQEANPPHLITFSDTSLLPINGQFNFTFPAALIGSSQYLVVKHRNHIETWSANPVTLSGNSNYDFSTSATQAFGDNQVQVAPGIFAFYSGDIDQSGGVDGDDFNLLDPDIQVGNGGYLSTDLDGSGGVDGDDFNIFDPNAQNGVGAFLP
ncbi:MAG: hypothetical protein JNJ58_12235 [Chitinophagaceae bacterium]|nr:hypothetical protein [Chitinophagaceae bacterium]